MVLLRIMYTRKELEKWQNKLWKEVCEMGKQNYSVEQIITKLRVCRHERDSLTLWLYIKWWLIKVYTRILFLVNLNIYYCKSIPNTNNLQDIHILSIKII